MVDLVRPKKSIFENEFANRGGQSEHEVELQFAGFVKKTSLLPQGTLISGLAGAGKTVLARALSLYVAEAQATGIISAPCTVTRKIVDSGKSSALISVGPAKFQLLYAFRIFSNQMKQAVRQPSGTDSLVTEDLTEMDLDEVKALSSLGVKYSKEQGSLSNIRNEMGPVDAGITLQLLDPVSDSGNLIYIIHSPIPEFDKILIKMKPLDLARALSFYSVTRIATVNAAFSSGLKYTSTLSGGLDEGLLYAIQSLSDMAAESGGRIIMETRDEHSSKDGGQDLNLFGLSAAKQRYMGVSKQAFYLKKLDAMAGRVELVYRVRSFTGKGEESQVEVLSYRGEDYPIALSGGRIEIPDSLKKFAEKGIDYVTDLQKGAGGFSENDFRLA